MNECFFLFVLYVHHVAWPGLAWAMALSSLYRSVLTYAPQTQIQIQLQKLIMILSLISTNADPNSLQE